MILNQVKKIYVGTEQPKKIYVGTEQVWPGRPAALKIDLDVTKFDAETPKLYDTDGTELGTLSMLSGAIADNVYKTEDGLRCTPAASCEIPVGLSRSDNWTILLKFKSLNIVSSGTANLIGSTGNTFQIALGFSNDALTIFTGGFNSRSMQIYNASSQYSSYGAVEEWSVPKLDWPYYENEVRWVNDGENVAVYVNGILKAKMASEYLPETLTNLYVATPSGLYYTNYINYIIQGLRVYTEALEIPSHNVYRFILKKFRGKETSGIVGYATKRICLYDSSSNRLDTDAGCVVAFARCLNGTSYNRAYDSSSDNSTKVLAGNNTGDFVVYNYYDTDDLYLYFCLPASLPALAGYSFITSSLSSRYDPVSWELDTTNDGGLTWTKIDEQSDATITESRSTETQIFTL